MLTAFLAALAVLSAVAALVEARGLVLAVRRARALQSELEAVRRATREMLVRRYAEEEARRLVRISRLNALMDELGGLVAATAEQLPAEAGQVVPFRKTTTH